MEKGILLLWHIIEEGPVSRGPVFVLLF